MAKVRPPWSKRITSSSSMSPAAQASTQSLMESSPENPDSGARLFRRGSGGIIVEFLAVWPGGRRQFALEEIVLVAQLAQEGRDHFAVAAQDRWRRRRQVVLDQRMQLRQRVVGHHREHVMFDM